MTTINTNQKANSMKSFYRETVRIWVRSIRWRRMRGMPHDKAEADLRYCLKLYRESQPCS